MPPPAWVGGSLQGSRGGGSAGPDPSESCVSLSEAGTGDGVERHGKSFSLSLLPVAEASPFQEDFWAPPDWGLLPGLNSYGHINTLRTWGQLV